MDYRYYRGEGPKLPKKLKKYIHTLRYVGTAMLLMGLIIPWLIILDIVTSIYFWNFLSTGFLVLGPILVLVGVAWDTFIDRG